MRPLIGITSDLAGDRLQVHVAYGRAVEAAGGVPIVLPCQADCAEQHVELCRGLILSGGDDPAMERWGEPTHPKARPLHPDRQAFELALLDALAARPDRPVLGICLGMQLMALHAGGRLDQHLPDTLPTADRHWGRVPHEVSGDLGAGTVLSHHRQAIVDPGSLRSVATAPDGVIEAVRDDRKPFYLGVQWHPERTEDDRLGLDLVRRLVAAAAR